MTLPHGIQDSTLNLEGSKSNYFILYWTFNDNGIPKLKAIDNTNNPVRLLLYDKPQEQLRSIRHDYDENHFKSLGTYISGSLNDDYEFHIAQSKIKTFTKFLLSCPLHPKETRIAYIQYLIPSILYGAVAQTFIVSNHANVSIVLSFLPYSLSWDIQTLCLDQLSLVQLNQEDLVSQISIPSFFLTKSSLY